MLGFLIMIVLGVVGMSPVVGLTRGTRSGLASAASAWLVEDCRLLIFGRSAHASRYMSCVALKGDRTGGGDWVGKITRQRRASRYRAKSRLAEMTDTLFYDIDWLYNIYYSSM